MTPILTALIEVLILAISIYTWFVIGSAVLSWLVAFNIVNQSNRVVNTIGEFLYRVTEPALRPIRNILPNLGPVDISPIVLLLALWFLQRVLSNYLYSGAF